MSKLTPAGIIIWPALCCENHREMRFSNSNINLKLKNKLKIFRQTTLLFKKVYLAENIQPKIVDIEPIKYSRFVKGFSSFIDVIFVTQIGCPYLKKIKNSVFFFF